MVMAMEGSVIEVEQVLGSQLAEGAESKDPQRRRAAEWLRSHGILEHATGEPEDILALTEESGVMATLKTNEQIKDMSSATQMPTSGIDSLFVGEGRGRHLKPEIVQGARQMGTTPNGLPIEYL